jgi:hypothetical protein
MPQPSQVDTSNRQTSTVSDRAPAHGRITVEQPGGCRPHPRALVRAAEQPCVPLYRS